MIRQLADDRPGGARSDHLQLSQNTGGTLGYGRIKGLYGLGLHLFYRAVAVHPHHSGGGFAIEIGQGH